MSRSNGSCSSGVYLREPRQYLQMLGCANAIFMLQSTIDYYRDKSSSVYASALDISKAFDTVNHFKLYSTLIKSGVPVWIIDVIIN